MGPSRETNARPEVVARRRRRRGGGLPSGPAHALASSVDWLTTLDEVPALIDERLAPHWALVRGAAEGLVVLALCASVLCASSGWGLEAAAWAQVRERSLEGRMLFSSFYDEILTELRAVAEGARIGVLVSPRKPERALERAREARSLLRFVAADEVAA